ncbi:hypothetical protein J40TS1_21510 [Paenibacillus montaniterrae]|uniref:Uncharacterized protein n=1 Tax=Paenibacillus montaniterrae TaxID=429341 RepID=A0A920CYZ9_9BACL|nr:hypothetical protein [Paenibacillus montaniterrae]GIP16509.1 hypothetical protein J40TS1_21510 [Paenibacillus montaniterrae]
MKRWQKVTIWIASILIVLVVGGLFAANYAVDKVLDSMVGMSVDDLIGEEDVNESGNSDGTVSPPTGNGDSETDTGTGTNDGAVGDPNQSVSSGNSQNTGNSTDPSNGGGTNSSNGGSDSSSSSSNGQQPNSSNGSNGEQASGSEQQGSSGSNSGGYSPEVSSDKAKEVEENISIKDKAKVVSTLMGSLSASDISALQKLASGGLSVEEKKEARDLLLEKLTEDQYNELIGIAAKHGLSQGKSYSEVKAE